MGCGLPSVPTYSVSPEFANAPLMYQSVPNPADIYPAGWAEQVATLFPDEVKNSTVMFGNFAATIDTKDKVLQTLDDFGFEFLDCPIEYNIAGEPDWKPFAQRMSDCGAEVVYYSGQPYPNMQNLLDDAAQVGLRPGLAHGLQRLPPVVRRLEHRRQRRPRVRPHRVHARSSRPTRTPPPSSTSTS